jgi:hypothetical protein
MIIRPDAGMTPSTDSMDSNLGKMQSTPCGVDIGAKALDHRGRKNPRPPGVGPPPTGEM